MEAASSAATFFSSTTAISSSGGGVEQHDTPATTTRMTRMNNQTTIRSCCHIVLLLENSRKNNNWGPVLRCASAFGIQTVVFVGFATCCVRGSHGADQHVEIIAFPTVRQAVDFIRHEYHHQHQQQQDRRHHHHHRRDELVDDNANNSNDTENTTSTTTCSPSGTTESTRIIGLLGAVPGGYSSDGCRLRLDNDGDDDDDDYDHRDTDEMEKLSNPAWGLMQAVAEDHVLDTSTRTTMPSPTCSALSLCGRSYPVSSAARMRHMLCIETTKTVVVAISKDFRGLSCKLAEHCDAFCHVPHVAIPDRRRRLDGADCDDSTLQQPQLPPSLPLLDLPTTLSIALYHITAHLGYREGEFHGQKFQVGSRKKSSLQNDDRKIQEHRANQQKQREQLTSDAMTDNGSLFLWQDEQSDDY
jgi:hypothetical protein